MTDEAKELAYNRARSFFDTKSENGYTQAKAILEGLLDYKEARKYYEICVVELNKLTIEKTENDEKKYLRACELMNKPTAPKLDTAIKYFRELGDYKDSAALADECQSMRQKIAIKDKKGIQKIKAWGLLFAGIGLIVVAIFICGLILMNV